MIRTWQNFDENHRPGWGQWYASRAVDGHIVQQSGPHTSEAEARRAVGDADVEETKTDLDSAQTSFCCILTALTDAGRDWLVENVGEDFDGYVEPRYIDDILLGAFRDGLTISIDGQAVVPAEE